MSLDIKNDEERKLYQKQLEQVLFLLQKQKTLNREAQIRGSLLDKLHQLELYLKQEIRIYDKLHLDTKRPPS
jgi:hypothetical protein